MVFTGSAGVSPAGFSQSENFPKQESIRRFRGIVVDSVVLEHDGGRGRPRSQFASIFGTVPHARVTLMSHEDLSINTVYIHDHEHVHPAVHGCFC
jgi:hypothetical protein